MDYTTGNMFSNGDGKHLNDDVNVLSEYYDGKVKKTASQIILEKYGVNKVFGQKPLDEAVVPWDLRGHVGFIVTRLSRRFGILKYLCYRQSMERRMSCNGCEMGIRYLNIEQMDLKLRFWILCSLDTKHGLIYMLMV